MNIEITRSKKQLIHCPIFGIFLVSFIKTHSLEETKNIVKTHFENFKKLEEEFGVSAAAQMVAGPAAGDPAAAAEGRRWSAGAAVPRRPQASRCPKASGSRHGPAPGRHPSASAPAARWSDPYSPGRRLSGP